ncbi:MAG: RsmB/NOP family class I SAM-dependent RNA methyltransferase [Candidatus Bathyarchaeota archaeon]|jgi:NOL1/NOP2/sun family putative RNA methylase|nr:MAG: RsmB/NOP family class I SAM-dependent RNA methyltransferase [Candidatus Bathyarchaeota archaeon]
MGWEFRDIRLKQSIRVHTSNAREKHVIQRLESRGVALERIPFLENGYWVQQSRFSVGATVEYLLGFYSIQEAAAQIPATLFNEPRNGVILDACAAPGMKTVQLADLMNNTGIIVALDARRRRLRALSNQLERCRVRNTIVYWKDARKASQLDLKFGCILLDVPCSGNFLLEENWFEKRSLRDIERNVRLQRQILTEASISLKDDGEIIYSTCSLEPEENEFNIDWAVKNLNLKVENIDCYGREAPTEVFGKQLDESIRDCVRIWPEQTQGFFICKLKKRLCIL